MRGKQSLPLRHLQSCSQLFLPFRSTVLKPGFNLDFGEVQGFAEFHSFADAEVFVDFEFALQPLQLFGAVGLARFSV